MVWRLLKKLGIKPPYDPAIPLLGIYPEKTKIERDTCIPLFACLALCSLSWFLFHLYTNSLSLWAVFWAFCFQLYLQNYFLFTCISNLCFFLNPPSFHLTLPNLFLTFPPDHLNNACFQIPWTLLLSAVLSDFSHVLHLLTFFQGVDVIVHFSIF